MTSHQLTQTWDSKKRCTLKEDFLSTVGELSRKIDDLSEENHILRDENRNLRLQNMDLEDRIQKEVNTQISHQEENSLEKEFQILDMEKDTQDQEQEREREKEKEKGNIEKQLMMDLEKEREKKQALEKQILMEIQKREEIEAKFKVLTREMEAMKRNTKNNKNTKPLTRKPDGIELGVPEKLVLPEAKAPKFWLKAVISKSSGHMLSLHDILECILRPFREDEVWGLLHEIAIQLHDLHKNNKSHERISLQTTGISRDGRVLLFEKSELAPQKFTAPEHSVHNSKDIHDDCEKCDIYGVGVLLWSVADYLNDEDEEPKISEDLCDCITHMTHDQPNPRPSAETLIQRTENYENASKNLLQNIFQEVDRKSDMRQQYEKGIISNQRAVIRKLLEEIKSAKPEQLKPNTRNSQQLKAIEPMQLKPTKQTKQTKLTKPTEPKKTWEYMTINQRIQMFNKH